MRHYRARCNLTVRSAWPLAPDGDKGGAGTFKAAKDSAAKSLTASVSTQPTDGKNRISAEFARRLLDDEGYNLACHSATTTSLGQIAAIVSWQGTARLWTTYFVLDEYLDIDLKLANSSWTFLATLMGKLPMPWPSVIARIIAELNSSQEPAEEGSNERIGSATAVHTCRTYLEAFSDTVSLTGSETSYAGSDASMAMSSASADSARTPTRVASSVDVSIAGTEDVEIEPVTSRRISTPMGPCRQSTAGNNEAVQHTAPAPSYTNIQSSRQEDNENYLKIWPNSKEVPDSWYDPTRFA
jgi:hypothetical protein